MPVSPNKIENSTESWNDADWNLFNIIRKTVKEDQKAVQETAGKCKRLFKQKNSPANPREVLTKLGELLRAGQDDQALAKHINLSKQGNSPKTPDELKESLKKQREDYECYIQHFLPALKAEITNSNKLDSKKKVAIVQTILEITNRSSNKDHFSSTIQNQKGRRNNQTDRQDNALGLFKNKSFSSEVAIAESSGSSALERNSLAKGVSGKGTPGTYKILRNSGYNSALTVPPLGQVRTLEASKETSLNPIAQSQLNGSFSQSDLSIDCKDLKNEKPSTTADAVEVPSGASTSKFSNDNGSDSGVSLGELSKESLKSPVSSRRSSLTLVTSTSSEESLNSTLSSTEEDNGLQPKDEGETKLAHLTKTRSKGPSGRRSPSKYHEKIEDQVKNGVSPGVIQVADTEIQREKNMDPDDQDTQKTGSQAKDSMQPEEKRDRKNAITTVQKLPVNEKKGEDIPLKQPNNRNLHVALVAGCALSTIGCIVAGAMTSGLVGAGLLAMAAVFAIAAVAELHSNFLSSKLTSINVSPLVDDKELTAL